MPKGKPGIVRIGDIRPPVKKLRTDITHKGVNFKLGDFSVEVPSSGSNITEGTVKVEHEVKVDDEVPKDKDGAASQAPRKQVGNSQNLFATQP